MSKTIDNAEYIEKYNRLRGMSIINPIKPPFTVGQKSYISKMYNKYKDIAEKPHRYIVRHVAKKTVDKIPNSSFKSKSRGKRGVIIIHNPLYADVKITKTGVRYNHKNGLTETVRFIDGTLENQAKNIFKNLKRGESLTLRMGDSASFPMSFTSEADFLKYLNGYKSASWQPKNPATKKQKQQLQDSISIVKVNLNAIKNR